MPRRSRPFAALVLLAFLLAQPVVGCAALCLLDLHPAGTHVMPAMDGARAVFGSRVCHTGVSNATPRSPVQALSPMEPSPEAVFAAAPAVLFQPAGIVPALSPQLADRLDPPPPRLA